MAVQTKIDINRASREDLMSIEGIGETMADAIIRYRDQKGDFKGVDDLDDVPGIGEGRMEHIKQFLSVSGESSRSQQRSSQESRSQQGRSQHEGRSREESRSQQERRSEHEGRSEQHGGSQQHGGSHERGSEQRSSHSRESESEKSKSR